MRNILRKHIVERRSSKDMGTKTFEIEATPNVMEAFEKFMAHLAWCAGVGHSTTVAMSIDGDGADSFYVNSGSDVKGQQAEEQSRYDRSIEVIHTGD